MTTLSVVADVWGALTDHIGSMDIDDAADSLVTVLVDVHGLDPQEIYQHFADHPAIRQAAKAYTTLDTVDDDDHYDDHPYLDDDED